MRKFAYSENDLDREKAASALNIPKELLEKLAKDFNRNVLVEVAQNPSTPLKSLKLLATHGNPDIREEAILHLISIPKKEWEMQSK